ncbi:peptidylprolyl isomerase [Paludisphaera soli]|uniref:peptidylprolyl isomerase n=1 Tax=Paludisphaera soli TaxID=2712865 RepID=UPI0013ED5ED8|nr:peptidylprolyl isomerase [Paludisphaera soli]
MRRIVFASLAVAATVVGWSLAAAPAVAQNAPAQPNAGAPPMVANPAEVVATVDYNGATEKITKGEVFNVITRYPIPATEDRELVYRDAVETLVNTKLVTQFLNRQRIAIKPEQVQEEIGKLEQGLKAEGKDLASSLLENGFSLDEIKKEIEDRLRWIEYVKAKATDAELKKYLAANNDLFSGTQVRASHILLKTEPNAKPEEKAKVKQQLLAVKKEIDGGKLTFAQAADKYSQDPANEGGAGGDLDYFNLNSGFIPEFTDVAFKLKTGSVSEPVETPYGYHLIQVTDRKEGKPVDFEQNKPYITSGYAAELQRGLLTEARKTAKIEVKPMPKDLFPPIPAQPPAGAPAAAPKAAPKAKAE